VGRTGRELFHVGFAAPRTICTAGAVRHSMILICRGSGRRAVIAVTGAQKNSQAAEKKEKKFRADA